MARYTTTIQSSLAPAEAFTYMADFANATEWDPSVEEALRHDSAAVGRGTAFDLVARFGRSKVTLHYVIVDYDPPQRVTLEAMRPSFTSRDTITVTASPEGSTIRYEASLRFRGIARVLDPVMQLLFTRVGNQAAAGLTRTLNR
jgi:hypothetical protein